MKTIKLKRIYINNFKGIEKVEINFEEKQTTVSADNGMGKTSLFDAFTWLLSGKDSQDSANFSVKNLVKTELNRAQHEVSADIEIDGYALTLRRIMEEKWQKKRGSTESEFTGHTTSFFYNEVPCNETEYKKMINDIISEDVLKLITSTRYFNEKMTWQQRREMLTKMAGDIDDSDIASKSAAWNEIYTMLTAQRKTLDQYKKEVSAKKKLLKEELETIPTRIDEVIRQKPSPVNTEEIDQEISTRETEIQSLHQQQNDVNAAMEKKRAEISAAHLQKSVLENDLVSLKKKQNEAKNIKIDELNVQMNQILSQKREKQGKIDQAKQDIASLEKSISEKQSRNNILREEYSRISALVFTTPDPGKCPVCGKDKDLVQTPEEMQALFNSDKAGRLEAINKEGKQNKALIEDHEVSITQQKQVIADNYFGDIDEKIESIKKEINSLENAIAPETDDVISLKKQIAAFVIPEMQATSNVEIQSKIHVLNGEISELKSRLQVMDQIKKADARIEELKAREKQLSGEISSIEGIEFNIDGFVKAKMEMVEESVSKLFLFVRFKMFHQNINGGFEPTCVCLVNGVPYSDSNTAGKINAGLDIINALQAYLGVSAPIWIDGRESINQPIPVNSQSIHLVVGREKQLTII